MSEKEKKWRGIGESAEISAPDPRIGEYIPFDEIKEQQPQQGQSPEESDEQFSDK